MKVSVSLPDDDIEFLDDYAASHGMASRSAAVHEAVRRLRSAGLGAAYQDAWSEWAADGEDDVWETATSDGVG
ncbi:MAG: ribbon-helix-helix domain-containing protein [Ilumatobacteraceae bacterium]